MSRHFGGDEDENIERRYPHFQGGEENGQYIIRQDVAHELITALSTVLYGKSNPSVPRPTTPDKTYMENKSYWRDALSDKHFPGTVIVLEDFHLMEWLPFAPGRYYSENARYERRNATRQLSPSRNEYLPDGKRSMVRGGIGAIRLAEKIIGGETFCFLGATSTGVAHQGIPVALPIEEYRKVIPIIKERGGCRVNLVGTLRSLSDNIPSLRYGEGIPRFCLFVEEIKLLTVSELPLLTTVAIMYNSPIEPRSRWDARRDDDPRVVGKSWTFCSFGAGSSHRDIYSAAEWMLDYATRYTHSTPTILTDFDEQHRVFSCPVEFPLSDIVHGKVDWETLHIYRHQFPGTFIDTYIKEYNQVTGDKIEVNGSGNTIINRSTVQNAFNKVKAAHDETTAKALTDVEAEINKSGNKEAAENFESFSEELTKPEPKKSLLKSLWQGTLAALPTIEQLPGVIDSITQLFS